MDSEHRESVLAVALVVRYSSLKRNLLCYIFSTSLKIHKPFVRRVVDECAFTEPPPTAKSISDSPTWAVHAKNSQASLWKAAVSTSRMYLVLMLYSLVEIRSWSSSPRRRMGLSNRGTLGMMGSWLWDTVYCWDCGHTHPRRGSTLPHQVMERGGYSTIHNGHFTAVGERLRWDTMGPFREMLLMQGPALGLCSQRTFIRLLLSPIPWRCVCRRPQGRLGIASIYPIQARDALSSQGRGQSRQGHTITRHWSLCCNEPGEEKLNWVMSENITIL